MSRVLCPPLFNLRFFHFDPRCLIPFRLKPAATLSGIQLRNPNCSTKHGGRFQFENTATIVKCTSTPAEPVYEMYDEYTTDLEDTQSDNENEKKKSGNFDFGFLNLSDSEDESPWEGAIMYRRDPTTNHLEYCTTLERLGLGDVSDELTKSRASIIGLRVTQDVKDFRYGTPVQLSVDVSRRKHNLRLDGVLRTVLSLVCYRCAEPAAKSIFTNFAFLLVPEFVEEPVEDRRRLRVRGEGKYRTFFVDGVEMVNGSDDAIESDDRLYFPPEATKVDLSKNIRDMIHVEIALDTLCHPQCKGLCDTCFGNLNTNSCECMPTALPNS